MTSFLVVSYSDYDYDGRLRELCKVVSDFGNVHAITRGLSPNDSRHILINGSYVRFIMQALKQSKRLNDRIDVLLLDNRKSIIPGFLIKGVVKPLSVCLDCRELYIFKEVKHLAGKIGCVIERFGIKHADIVTCASRERAELMKRIYSLAEEPLVFENARRLEYSDDKAEDECRAKYAHLIREGEIRIISTAGCDLSRKTAEMIEAVSKLELPHRLFLVGGGRDSDIRAIEALSNRIDEGCIEILGRVGQDDLKYLIGQSHIGIVSYHQGDTNNRLCASGKIYEYIYESIPVVTTTNPPLSSLCEKEGIGVADDGFYDGFVAVLNSYDSFKENAKRFADSNPIEKNNMLFRKRLKQAFAAFGESNGR